MRATPTGSEVYNADVGDSLLLVLIIPGKITENSELKIRIKDNSEYLLHFLTKPCCELSSEPSHRDGSIEGSHHTDFWEKTNSNKENLIFS